MPTPRSTRAKAGANLAPAPPFFSDSGPVSAPGSAKNGPVAGDGGSGATLHRGADELADARGPHPLLVLPVLEDRPERRLHRALVEVGAAQGGEGHGPVDGLRHPRRLVQLEA